MDPRHFGATGLALREKLSQQKVDPMSKAYNFNTISNWKPNPNPNPIPNLQRVKQRRNVRLKKKRA